MILCNIMMECGVSMTADWPGPGSGTALEEQRELSEQADGRRGRLVAQRIEAGEQRRIAAHLAQALDAGMLQPQFQPRIALASGAIMGAETKLGMPHRRRGMIPLDEMVKVLGSKSVSGRMPPSGSAMIAPGHAASSGSAQARFGLVERINDFVLHKACVAAMDWPASWSVALNIGIYHAATAPFLAAMDRELAAARLAPKRIEIEIAEAELVESGAAVREELAALDRLGIGIVLDEFGHSYASLSLLRRMNLVAVKLDRSLTRNLQVSSADRALLAAAVEISHSLGITVAADGVETKEQFDLICAAGCDQAQGSWFTQTIADPGIPRSR